MRYKGKITEKLEEDKTKGQKLRAYCNTCKRDREHVVVVSADQTYSEEFDEHFSLDAEDNYQVIKCSCGALSFRHLSWFSEYQDEDSSGHTEKFYPVRELPHTLPTKEFDNVPDLISEMYQQTVRAFNQESYILCAAGLRVIVEGICEVKAVKDGPVQKLKKGGGLEVGRSKKLDGKIAGLFEKEILTQKHADMLHEHRFLGNDAVHDLAEPSARELRLAIDIIEHILEQIFEIPQKAELLKAIRLHAKKRAEALKAKEGA